MKYFDIFHKVIDKLVKNIERLEKVDLINGIELGESFLKITEMFQDFLIFFFFCEIGNTKAAVL